MENFTSCGVTGEPLENLASRSLKVQVLPSAECVHDSASPGSSLSPLPSTSWSKICWIVKIEPLLGTLIGFRHASASSDRAILSVPPVLGVTAPVPSGEPDAAVLELLPPHAASTSAASSATLDASALAALRRDFIIFSSSGTQDPCLWIQ